jgi:ABC-2 type transport system ATP-binding protein
VSVIEVSGLVKSYGRHEVLHGISFAVETGEVFGLLGPNGAGKTTTVEILEGYRARNAGEVSVLGTDPAAARRSWRERIGIVLQECRLTPELTVREAVEQYAGYYPSARDVGETVALVGLGEKADVRTSKLSGGQQRRLDVALALVGDPELLFLDEPTTGFDPAARRQAWEVIGNLRNLGKTIFLTTHYMEEAQSLADRVAILSAGQVVAEGAPGELATRDARSRISFRVPIARRAEVPAMARDGAQLTEAGEELEVSLRVDDPVPALRELTVWATDRDVPVHALEVRRPTLEDVYLELTGAERGEELEA